MIEKEKESPSITMWNVKIPIKEETEKAVHDLIITKLRETLTNEKEFQDFILSAIRSTSWGVNALQNMIRSLIKDVLDDFTFTDFAIQFKRKDEEKKESD